MLFMSCSTGVSPAPEPPAVQRVVIATGALDYVEVPFRGRTQVVVQARAADGSILRDAPTPTLISRDTTRFLVEPGLWVRSVEKGGSTVLVAKLVVGGRTLMDSVRISAVSPIN